MKKFFLLITAVVLSSVVNVSCSDDSGVDNVCKVSVEQNDIVADGKGEEFSINVQSNAYWRFEFTDEYGETIRWVTVDKSSGAGNDVVTLKVDRNRSISERSATIRILTEDTKSESKILLTQLSGMTEATGYTFPIFDYFQLDESAGFSNGFIDGNSCYFDGGLVITRLGGTPSLTFLCPCHTAASNLPKANSQLQRGITAALWETGCAWLFEIPVKEQLSGDLRLMFGSRRDNITSAGLWSVEWSNDGSAWTPFVSNFVTGSDAVWKYIDFTIPSDKAVVAGGKLYIKMTPTDPTKVGSSSNPTALFHHGICIYKQTAPASSVPAANATDVVYSDGFDDLTSSPSAYMEWATGFMASCHGGTYSLPVAKASCVTVESCYVRPGYLQLGGADDAKNTYTKAGKYTIAMKNLEQMGITTTDLTITFRASLFMPATGTMSGNGVSLTVDETSGASIDGGGTINGLEANNFKEFTVTVKNATKNTFVSFTNLTDQSDKRFFLDDVVVKVKK